VSGTRTTPPERPAAPPGPPHDRIFVVEAGGRKERFEAATAEIERVLGSLSID
jgi:hypothetical protein